MEDRPSQPTEKFGTQNLSFAKQTETDSKSEKSNTSKTDDHGWKTAYFSKHVEEERSIFKKTQEEVTTNTIKAHDLIKNEEHRGTTQEGRKTSETSKSLQQGVGINRKINFDKFSPKLWEKERVIGKMKKGASHEDCTTSEKEWEVCKKTLLKNSDDSYRREGGKMEEKLKEIQSMIKSMKDLSNKNPETKKTESFSSERTASFEEYKDPTIFPLIQDHVWSFTRTQSFPGSRRPSMPKEKEQPQSSPNEKEEAHNSPKVAKTVPITVEKDDGQFSSTKSFIRLEKEKPTHQEKEVVISYAPKRFQKELVSTKNDGYSFSSTNKRIVPTHYKTCVIEDLQDGSKTFSTAIILEVAPPTISLSVPPTFYS